MNAMFIVVIYIFHKVILKKTYFYKKLKEAYQFKNMDI